MQLCAESGAQVTALRMPENTEGQLEELRQRLQQQYLFETRLLFKCLKRLVKPPKKMYSFHGHRWHRRRRLESCVLAYHGLVMGPDSLAELALTLENEVPYLYPRDFVRRQWDQLGASRNANEQLIIEAMLHKPLSEHHDTIMREYVKC